MHAAGAPIRHAMTFLLAGSIVSVAPRAGAQQPMQAGGLAPPPPMQTGGLAPPPPGSGPPPPAPPYPNAAQRQLEEAEHSDSGRGLEFVYFDVGGGGQFAALSALSESGKLVPASDKSSAFGPSFSAAAGIRLLYLTVGPRFRFAHFTDWDLWTLNLDIGWHIPLGNLEPYGILGGGFAKLGRSAEGIPGVGDVSISGFNVRLGGGVDYYLSSVLSVGGALHADLMRLSRAGTPPLRSAGDPGSPAVIEAISRDASSLGLVLTAGAVVGLHF